MQALLACGRPCLLRQFARTLWPYVKEVVDYRYSLHHDAVGSTISRGRYVEELPNHCDPRALEDIEVKVLSATLARDVRVGAGLGAELSQSLAGLGRNHAELAGSYDPNPTKLEQLQQHSKQSVVHVVEVVGGSGHGVSQHRPTFTEVRSPAVHLLDGFPDPALPTCVGDRDAIDGRVHACVHGQREPPFDSVGALDLRP